MANLHTISEDSQFQPKVASAGSKLVVVDFNASWCQPCRTIAPAFASLATKYSSAVFLKVDVDQCTETARQYNITAMPTFVFLKGGTKVDELKGADPVGLEEKIKSHCQQEADAGVPGYIDLNSLIDKRHSECLNQSDDHVLEGCLKKGEGYLESDCDEQLMILLSFQQNVKLHSLRLLGPKLNGPKEIKLFINLPNTMGFDQAERTSGTQELTITEEELAGEIIPLRFVKFQNVSNVTVFVKNNQGDEETTRIDYLGFIGARTNTTNMGEFKRVAGKKGESH
ncbi:thioredoxin-like protein 1 [Diadema antillarum]|uniref:thioredoxin-like protein 1 n=1 Tax=Diadema antillarum TaxID=105358 RepID=UPI003A8C7923